MAAGAAAAVAGRRSATKVDATAEDGKAARASRTAGSRRSSADLQLEYSWNRGESRLLWDHARQAMRAAWDRVDRG